MSADRPPARHRQPGDGWVECGCGRRHWGLHGAAGLLLVQRDESGAATHVVLQHRAPWSDHGDTWGIPGGAIAPDETPTDGALREAHEEAGVTPASVTVIATTLLDHGAWSYTTVIGEVTSGAVVDPRATDAESVTVAWVSVDDVDSYALHPAFAAAWPALRRVLRPTR